MIGFQDASAFINLAALGAINVTHSSSPNSVTGDLAFYTKPSGSGYIVERARLLANGNFGINITNPAAKFVVTGVSSNASFEVDNGSGYVYLQSYDRVANAHQDMYFYTTGSVTAILNTAGRLLLNKSVDDGNRLQVNGDISLTGSVKLSVGQRVSVGSGKLQSAGNVSVSTSATTIYTSQQVSSIDTGNIVLVTGVVAGTGANFTDLVIFMTNGSATTISSQVIGSPASRTYTVSGNNLQLAMGSGTYGVACSAITQGYTTGI